MLHTLNSQNKRKKRVGRGGARGTNCGAGHKGQKSRAGARIRPALRDEIEKIPKRRGHNKNRARGVRFEKDRPKTVTLSQLDRLFEANAKITPSVLLEKQIVSRYRGNVPNVKIVCRGEITKPLNFYKVLASDSAKVAIEKAGGKVNL